MLAVVAAGLTAAAATAAGPVVGVVDDAGKYSDNPGSFFSDLSAAGLTENRVTVLWDPDNPTAIQDQAFLARSLPAALASGIRIVIDVYPSRALAFATDTDNRIAQFAAYLQAVARLFPQVKDFIVLNEPNQPRFFQPQFGGAAPDSPNVSGATAYKVMKAAYDALKAVDPSINVIGLGLSPRGNDRPDAPNNISTSPVRFLKSFCDAYRADGRTAPVMDQFGFHPYPNPQHQTDAPSVGYQWPNAGVPNLDRIKQAWQDGCAGIGTQKDFTNGLTFKLDEVGWQVAIPDQYKGLYTGNENVLTVDEETQATYYGQLLDLFACDSTVNEILLFHLIDETDLDRFQSGLERADGSHRPSYDTVKQKIAGGPGCPGSPHTWTPATGVLGASSQFGESDKPGAQKDFFVRATSEEDAGYSAGLFLLGGPTPPAAGDVSRGLQATPSLTKVASASGNVKAYLTQLIKLSSPKALTPGYYVYGLTLKAAMNGNRTTILVSKVFKVGQPGAAATKSKPKPKIVSFSPASGKVGTSVTIAGTSFTGATAVKFNGRAAAFTVISGTTIRATVASGTTTGKIAVTNAGGTATSSSSWTVLR